MDMEKGGMYAYMDSSKVEFQTFGYITEFAEHR